MNSQQNEDHNRAAGTNHKTSDEKPVLDAANPALILLVTLAALLFMGLLGWGILIVFAK